MFVHYRTKGFVFKKIDRGESAQLFSVYTKDFGKLKILGKGIRKISSKLRAGIETFYLSEIEFIQGKSYKTLTDAVAIEKFKDLRKDLKKLNIAYRIAGTLDDLIKGEEKDKRIWDLLTEVFNKLNDTDFKNPELIYYYFFWNFLSFLGYRPEMYSCPVCGNKLKPEKLYFNPSQGGVICKNCLKDEKSDIEIKPEIVKIIRIIINNKIKIISRLKIDKEQIKCLKEISDNYYSFLLEISVQK